MYLTHIRLKRMKLFFFFFIGWGDITKARFWLALSVITPGAVIMTSVKFCHCRFEEDQQSAAQQQAHPSSSQPQAQSRFAQESMLPMAGGANSKDQTSEALGSGSMDSAPSVQGPASTSSSTEGTTSQHASMTQRGSSKQTSMTMPAKYEQDDSLDFLPAQRRAPTQHAMSELEQQGWAAVNSPAGQTTAARQAANPDEVAALAAQNPRGRHRSQHTLSEQEQQGSAAKPFSTVQGSVAQPLLRGPSPQELELVANHQPSGSASPTRDSATRDLTELEQQGSFTLTPDLPQRQAGNLDGAEAAELAQELARRKGAQAELERQYSQLQLQHQQVLSLYVQFCADSILLAVCLSVCLSVCLWMLLDSQYLHRFVTISSLQMAVHSSCHSKLL